MRHRRGGPRSEFSYQDPISQPQPQTRRMDSYPLRRSNPATDPWLLPRTVSQRTSPATAYARVIVSPYGCRAGSRPRSRCSPAPATATSAFPPRAVPFPIAATFVSLALAAGHHRCSYRNRSYIPGGRRPAAPSVAYNGHHAPVSGQGEAAERLAAVRQRARRARCVPGSGVEKFPGTYDGLHPVFSRGKHL